MGTSDLDKLIDMFKRANIPFKMEESSCEKYIDIEACSGNVVGYMGFGSRFCFKKDGKLDRIVISE